MPMTPDLAAAIEQVKQSTQTPLTRADLPRVIDGVMNSIKETVTREIAREIAPLRAEIELLKAQLAAKD